MICKTKYCTSQQLQVLKEPRSIKYLGIVTTQAVQGTNIFSDMFAEVRDVVGGYSASYQNKLKLMEDRVILD